MSYVCHTSVTKWTLAAGAEVNSKQKKERRAKVAGEVVYITILALNEYFDGNGHLPYGNRQKRLSTVYHAMARIIWNILKRV